MKLVEYAHGLRPHDASVAIALLELVRRAGSEGTMERGDWLVAVYSAYRADDASGAITSTSPEELGPYLEENILGRLQSDGIAGAEPEGEGWERVRIHPEIWQEVMADRAVAVADLERAVRNLLQEPDRRGPAALETAAIRSPGGSSLS